MTDFTRNSTDSEVWIGATQIAGNILADTSPRAVRRVRHLHETGQIPTFKLNRSLALRPSTWRDSIDAREAEADARRAAARAAAAAA